MWHVLCGFRLHVHQLKKPTPFFLTHREVSALSELKDTQRLQSRVVTQFRAEKRSIQQAVQYLQPDAWPTLSHAISFGFRPVRVTVSFGGRFGRHVCQCIDSRVRTCLPDQNAITHMYLPPVLVDLPDYL